MRCESWSAEATLQGLNRSNNAENNMDDVTSMNLSYSAHENEPEPQRRLPLCSIRRPKRTGPPQHQAVQDPHVASAARMKAETKSA